MLTEVAIALAMMGILLTPILMLQYSVFKRVIVNKDKLGHLLPLKPVFDSVLIEPLKEDETTKQEELQEPLMQIVYKKSPAEGSEFSRFKDLFKETVTGTWEEWGGKKEESLVNLLFVPQPPDEEKKEQ